MATGSLQARPPRGLSGVLANPWVLAAASAAGAVLVCGASQHWPDLTRDGASTALVPAGTASGTTGTAVPPFVEVVKLAVAALMGLVITLVQRRTRPGRAASPSMEQAQVLLTVSGALMMIVIGNSLARAFGIAGAASIVRFRTPVEDPRDVTVLFLLMGLGMAAGLGALPVAALGTAFLACCLIMLSRLGESSDRCMKVALVASGSAFPTEHVEAVFASRCIQLEPLELTQGDTATMRYRARLSRQESIDELSAQLLNGGSTGIKSVSWEVARKNG